MGSSIRYLSNQYQNGRWVCPKDGITRATVFNQGHEEFTKSFGRESELIGAGKALAAYHGVDLNDRRGAI